MDKLQLGVVGLGQRGWGLLGPIMALAEIEVVAVCDSYPDRVDAAIKKLEEGGRKAPVGYSSFDSLLADPQVKAVLVCTSWESHIGLAIQAIRAGKITGMEVGGAYSLQDCYDLVAAEEECGTPFMMMENCCYDRFELLSTALVRHGDLGEVVHAHGAYSHDLRDEVLGGNVNRHYRLRNYLNRNCENYPTHELGPIAKILGINRGNRMVKMVSTASPAKGLQAFEKDPRNPDPSIKGVAFKQGDVIDTLIVCENGETISLTLNTTLPTYYSREFKIQGTKGLTNQEANMVFLDGKMDSHEFFDTEKTIEKYLNNANEYRDLLPDYWKNITPKEIDLGHGGMDYYMLKEFARHALEGSPMPIDVYDAAAWMAITPLSAISIAESRFVEIPDFTRGAYKKRPLEDVVKL